MVTETAHRDFLLKRGYTDARIEAEGWFSLPNGVYKEHGFDLNFRQSMIAVLCKTPVGTVTAIQLVNPKEKGYRRFRTQEGIYLPVYFASEEDFQFLAERQEVFLTEGVFDRIAIKQGHQGAVFALLGLGLSEKLARFLCLRAIRVWLVLDRDEKGLEAQKRIQRTLREKGLQVEQLVYAYKDPATWLEKKGLAVMRKGIEGELRLKGW